VQRVKITPTDAIARIHAAGGVAVAAHPGRTRLSDEDIEMLVVAGLDGLEAYYPRHRPAEVARFERAAERHSLLLTGGSDDHGDVHEGRLLGTIRLPYVHVERLKAAVGIRGGLAVANGPLD
jgi:predicted metal-dependent phosphoesterase TrpH